MIRVAAVGDIHIGPDSPGSLRPKLHGLADEADILLLAGDLTKSGAPREVEVLVEELREVLDVGVPILAVLGNHDHHSGVPSEVTSILEAGGVVVLDGAGTTLSLHGVRVGVAGDKGFGGGFEDASGSEFGEDEMKTFMSHTRRRAEALEAALLALDTPIRIALMHYSPVRETLRGEHPELYPFLGSYQFAEACDRAGVHLVLHGHAHHGSEHGSTPAGIPVRNVALPVLRRPYAIYLLEEEARETPGLGPRFTLRDVRDVSSSTGPTGDPARRAASRSA
jgi:Icc-related predicted phosphoesterase